MTFDVRPRPEPVSPPRSDRRDARTGRPEPAVSAENQHGETVTTDFEGPTVVYFYPEDFTGGCTIEANDSQDALPEFRESDIAVYGVSLDDVGTHADFSEAEGIEFDLLADPSGHAREVLADTREAYLAGE